MQNRTVTCRVRRAVRHFLIVFAVAVSLTSFAPPTAADRPTRTQSSISCAGGELTGICPFTILVDGAFTINQTDFVNVNGTLTRSAQHVTQQDTFSANGKTLGPRFLYCSPTRAIWAGWELNAQHCRRNAANKAVCKQ